MPELKQGVPDFSAPQYETLILSLLKGTCIFIGAGVSKLAGYRLWGELRDEMVGYFWRQLPTDKRRELDLSLCETLKKHGNIIEAFDYLYYLDRDLFVSGIKHIFNTDSKQISNTIYQVLNKLNVEENFFITTNIDNGFQNYLNIPEHEVSIYPDFNTPPKLISYLHGRIDREDTWIFTHAQYNRGYVSDPTPCLTFLKYIFENYNVLFIGYGLGEDDIIKAISLTSKRKTHYWIEGIKRNNEDYLKIHSTTLKENCNINLIPYCIDIEDRELLQEVINSLCSIMTIKKRGTE